MELKNISIYTIGDLHLSFSVNKPMDVFSGWDNYTEKLQINWNNLVKAEDTVVVVGDISWGMTTDECISDFDFINKLNGEKIILKGNHDYWFSTKKKVDDFLIQNHFHTIKVLHNCSYEVEGISICGTRGWINDNGQPLDIKVLTREAGRLRLSLDSKTATPIVFLHYPPIYNVYKSECILQILKEYGIKECYYGHIHGSGINYAIDSIFDGIDYHLVSADYLDFKPVLVR